MRAAPRRPAACMVCSSAGRTRRRLPPRTARGPPRLRRVRPPRLRRRPATSHRALAPPRPHRQPARRSHRAHGHVVIASPPIATRGGALACRGRPRCRRSGIHRDHGAEGPAARRDALRPRRSPRWVRDSRRPHPGQHDVHIPDNMMSVSRTIRSAALPRRSCVDTSEEVALSGAPHARSPEPQRSSSREAEARLLGRQGEQQTWRAARSRRLRHHRRRLVSPRHPERLRSQRSPP
jgi:hypothetical protein